MAAFLKKIALKTVIPLGRCHANAWVQHKFIIQATKIPLQL